MVWRVAGSPRRRPRRPDAARPGAASTWSGSARGEISGRDEIAPSIFVRTRSTAPEHPAHIIATFKTIGSLMAAKCRFGEAGSGGARCGSRCAAKTRISRTNSTRPESACQSKSQAERARTCLGASVPAARAIRFPRKTLNAFLHLASVSLTTGARRSPGACGAAPVRPVRASRARARARRGARVPARSADAVPRRVGRIRRGAVLPSRKA